MDKIPVLTPEIIPHPPPVTQPPLDEGPALDMSQFIRFPFPEMGNLKPTRHRIADNNPWRNKMPTTLMPRPPKFNASGKEAGVYINSHRILSYPTKKIWQYDVSKVDSGFSSGHPLLEKSR